MRSKDAVPEASGTSDGSRAPGLLVLADDLSGAAEVAVLLGYAADRTRIVLHPASPEDEAIPGAAAMARTTCANRAGCAPDRAPEVLVLDLDSRRQGAGAARRLVGEGLAAIDRTAAAGPGLLKKLDSQLRGNVGAEVAALHAAGIPVVVAPALPVARRVVRGGVLHLDGIPMHETDAWRAESCAPPRSVVEALAPVPATVVGLDVVRGPEPGLRDRLRALTDGGLVAACDAETDADLDAIVAAATSLAGACLVGSGGIAAAVGRRRGAGESAAGPVPVTEPIAESARAPVAAAASEDRPRPTPAARRGLLVVVGTGEPAAVGQVARLAEDGVPVHDLAVGELLDRVALDTEVAAVAQDVRGGPAVLRLHAPDGVVAGAGRRLAIELAAVAARVVAAAGPEPVDLVLTGGETARCVLDALAVTALTPVAQIHHGAVHSRTDDGRSVVTRPGSFGDPDSLVAIVAALRPGAQPSPTPSTPPRGPHV